MSNPVDIKISYDYNLNGTNTLTWKINKSRAVKETFDPNQYANPEPWIINKIINKIANKLNIKADIILEEYTEGVYNIWFGMQEQQTFIDLMIIDHNDLGKDLDITLHIKDASLENIIREFLGFLNIDYYLDVE